jgi:hypothetical protein
MRLGGKGEGASECRPVILGGVAYVRGLDEAGLPDAVRNPFRFKVPSPKNRTLVKAAPRLNPSRPDAELPSRRPQPPQPAV